MNKQIALSLAAAALALLTLPVLAALPPEYAGSPTQKDFPRADVLVLSDLRTFTLLPDGRVETKVRRVEKVLNYEGVDLVGDPKVAFNSKTQELKFARSRTWTPAGAAVDTKANGFTEMTPFALEKAPAYTDIRQMVVTRVGIEVGSVVEMEYTLNDRTPWRRFLDGAVPVRDESPVLLRQVVVAVPDGKPLRYAVRGASGEPARTRAEGRDVYTWTWKDLPALLEADTSPEEQAYAPHLLFTTAPDWSAQVNSLLPLVEKSVGSVSPEMKKKVSTLLEGAKGDSAEIYKLHEYVASSFRTVGWPLGAFDWKPRDASEVFDSGYGHALDKGVLLAALLKEAGVKSVVGLGGGSAEAGAPCLSVFGEVAVRVEPADGEAMALDPTAKLTESSHKDMTGMTVLPIWAGIREPHDITRVGARDLLEVSVDAKAGEDLSLEGTASFTMEGYYSPFYAARDGEDALKGSVDGLLASILPGAETTSVSVQFMEPGRCAFKASFKAKAPKPAGPAKVLRVGSPNASALQAVHGLHRTDRDLPAILPCPADEHVSLKLTLPAKLAPKALPREVKVENGVGKALQSSSFKEGTLTVERTLTIPKAHVPAASWADLRTLANTLEADPAKLVVF